jgi:S-adenosylmethionine:tRNA ribosyltransferase-isomerase
MGLRLTDFDYTLPKELIAQEPVHPRDHCKLMVIERNKHTIHHQKFTDLLDWLLPGDVLVLNQTKVFPARLHGTKATGGKVELLLLTQTGPATYRALVKPGLALGQSIYLPKNVSAAVIEVKPGGDVEMEFSIHGTALLTFINRVGLTPLPPYIQRMMAEDTLRQAYQTVYARESGSAAAPTAGLHFTPRLLEELAHKGVKIEKLTLHVGLGTFQRLRFEEVEKNHLHEESFSIDPLTASRIVAAKKRGARVVAVGTTTVRALESANVKGELTTGTQTTSKFIFPPYHFGIVDALITNFHLPQSSLLMMVAALVTAPQTHESFRTFSTSLIGEAYRQAVKKSYRFFSFGDAMLITD